MADKFDQVFEVLEEKLGLRTRSAIVKLLESCLNSDLDTYKALLKTDPQLESALITPKSRLWGKNAISFVLDWVTTNRSDAQTRLEIEQIAVSKLKIPAKKVVRANLSYKEGEVAKRRKGSGYSHGYFSLRYLADVDKIDVKTEKVHITVSSLTKLAVLEKILTLGTNVKEIRVSPSIMGTHMGAMKIALIQNFGVKLTVGRERNLPHYIRPAASDQMLARRDFFVQALKDSDNRKFFDEIKSLDLEEAIICQLLFLGKDPVSMSRVAEELGLGYPVVQKKAGAILYCFGYRAELGDLKVIAYANSLRTLVNTTRTLGSNRRKAEAYRREHAVGDLLPPLTLSLKLWPIWKKIQELIKSSPDILAEISDRDRDIVESYYQLSPDSKKSTLDELGQRYNLSKERIRQIKNLVLEKWGLQE